MAIVTYTGTADRYYVTDKAGGRYYLRRGQAIDLPDELAAPLRGRAGFTVEATTPKASEESK